MSDAVDVENAPTSSAIAGVRELCGLRVTTASVGPHENNVYLLECATTGERLLIDAAAEPAVLLGMIGDGRLGQVFTTHFHYDHWGALREVVERTGATTLMHPADAVGVPVPTDIEIRDGDEVRIGDVMLRAVHLIGHTLGSLALVHAEPDGHHHIWTGDSLFPGGVGKTHGEPALFDTLYRDVVGKLFDIYDDSAVVYPGHGAPTTLGAERPSLAQWRDRGW
ncbi:MBL fold metallo-hydrolase [Streptomyces malaysiensis]|uniref:Zn-dependent hydrolase n=1 Tax=Streptomyces malaysiensis TaxID=92644 RepID=A0A7X5XA61_STRMQ|nr:MBL fold metallo-hydrolase [Streptomyces malaysiensis]NIY69435.1 Zn-dependent hydrolase [Streptomyces malaysiensis]